MGVNKKKRKSKTSKGIHGSTKTALSEVQKVLLGGGLAATFKPIGSMRH